MIEVSPYGQHAAPSWAPAIMAAAFGGDMHSAAFRLCHPSCPLAALTHRGRQAQSKAGERLLLMTGLK